MKEKGNGFDENALMYGGPEEFECMGVLVRFVPLSMKRMFELRQISRQGAKLDPVELAVELKAIEGSLEDGNVDLARAGIVRLLAAAEEWQVTIGEDLLESIVKESEILISNWEEIREEALERWTPGIHRYVNQVIYMAAQQNSTVEVVDRAMQLIAEAENDEALKKSFGPKTAALLTSIPRLRLRFLSDGDTGKKKSSTGPSPSTTAD